MEDNDKLTKQEEESIEDYDNRQNEIKTKGGITEVKSKTGSKFENSCYGK